MEIVKWLMKAATMQPQVKTTSTHLEETSMIAHHHHHKIQHEPLWHRRISAENLDQFGLLINELTKCTQLINY